MTLRRVLLSLMIGAASALHAAAQPNDSTICTTIISSASGNGLLGDSIAVVIPFVGRQFLGAPYEAGTLETPGPERLVVNLRRFDCVTYVECVLAISRCISGRKTSYEDFLRELEHLRYRGGVLDGYPSRLHYFSGWIEDNSGKHEGRDVTPELGGISYRKTINFMSKHPRAYPRLASDTILGAIVKAEKELARHRRYYIPAPAIRRIEPRLQTGDVIAFTSATGGLDIGHTGFAIRLDDGSIHLLHASEPGGKVKITPETLDAYVRGHRDQTGIMVFRPTDRRH